MLPRVVAGTWAKGGSTHDTAGLQQSSRSGFIRQVVREVKYTLPSAGTSVPPSVPNLELASARG